MTSRGSRHRHPMVQFRENESRRDQTTAKYRNWESLGEQSKHTPFKDLIQQDPVVCDHCFLYRYDTLTRDWWRQDLGGWNKYETWTAIPGRGEPVPAQMPAQGMRLACANCGYRSGEKHRPVPKHEVYEFATNIAEVLRRKSINFDSSRYVEEIRERASKPEFQCKQDSHVFGPAVREAIHRN